MHEMNVEVVSFLSKYYLTTGSFVTTKDLVDSKVAFFNSDLLKIICSENIPLAQIISCELFNLIYVGDEKWLVRLMGDVY